MMPDPLLDARIYVADDDQSNRELLLAWLEQAGFRNVSAATNGVEVLEMVHREMPDLLLLDVMMPRMDGYQVIEHIRGDYPDRFIPIVLLSALQHPEHRVKGIEAGANDFLTKPCDPEELFARVRSLLGHKQAIDHLNAERARTAALLSQIGNPVIVTDPGGVITQVNPAAQEQLSVGEPSVGRGLGDVFGQALDDLVIRAQERMATVSGVYSPPEEQAGRFQAFNVSVSPIPEVGHILFWQDITGLQEAERARLEVERAQTKHVFDTFSQYMSPALVERVLQDSGIMDHPDQREATMMFADLRGFTDLSARQPPDQVMALLNEIFTDMIEVVNSHAGLILDIVGDELMVAFNVPYPQEDSVERAIKAATEIQRQFNRGRLARQQRDMQVGLGIGINHGPVVLGPIGGRSHKSYTMIGETVNLAHRMVELAEDRQIIIVSDLVRDRLPPDSDLEVSDLARTKIQGIPKPVRLSVIKVVERDS